MKYTTLFIVICLTLFSCTNRSELSKKFNCKSYSVDNSKLITDFNKNFNISISNSWKTNLYFSEYESEINTADTLKPLTDSFILGASFCLGVLNINTDFYKKTDSILTNNNLQLIKSGNDSFQSNPTYWYVSKGLKNGFTYHQFNLISKLSENTYFKGYSEVYGNDNIDERICESISILENVKFLQ